MNALSLTLSVLASDTPTNNDDLPGCCWIVLFVMGLMVWGGYRLHRREEERVAEEQEAADQAAKRAEALTDKERQDWECRLIGYLYPRGPLTIQRLAIDFSEHQRFMLDLVSPMLNAGDLDTAPEGDSDELHHQAFSALSESTTINLTPQGAARRREINPVVNHNYGDTVHAHGGSTVNNRSVVVGSFNRFVAKYDEETAAALVRLEDLVRRSGNVDAQEYLDAFLEEAQRESPRRSILRSLFDGIQQAVPTVAQAGDILLKVQQLMS